jgi:hypothetical protein
MHWLKYSNTEQKSHFLSAANSYMFRQQGANSCCMYWHLMKSVSCDLLNCILDRENCWGFLNVKRKEMRDMNDI